MKTSIVIDIAAPIPCLAKLWFSNYGPKCCQPIKLQDSLRCNISRKKWMMNYIFGKQTNLSSTSWYYHIVCVTRHAQSIQNNKFSIFLQYLKENVKDGVDFYIQISMKVSHKLVLWFWWNCQAIPKFWKSKFAMCLQHLKK